MIVGVVTALLLGASVVLVARLRALDADRAAGRRTIATVLGPTATRVAYSVLVVTSFAILPLAWAIDAIPTAGLLPFLTAPLAIRLGDTVSHRAGRELEGAPTEALLFALGFLFLLGVAIVLDGQAI